jgi:hypothetical protein
VLLCLSLTHRWACRVSSAAIALVLIANAFDGCLVDPGTAAAAMACCKHQRHNSTDAVTAADCCKTRNAGTRVADASAFDGPAAGLQLPALVSAFVVIDGNDARAVARWLPSRAAESPPTPPPVLNPLRI